MNIKPIQNKKGTCTPILNIGKLSLPKSKRAAMEMSMGTIVTIVLLMSVLILGLVLVRQIFGGATESVTSIDDQTQNEIQNLFGSTGDNLVVNLGSKNTAQIKQGTENFGISIGFSPNDPDAWGSAKSGCKYSLEAQSSGSYCIRSEWRDVEDYVKTGTVGVKFDKVDNLNGYSSIKIDVPETVAPCLQRFNILAECTNGESYTNYFDVEVIKKGLF